MRADLVVSGGLILTMDERGTCLRGEIAIRGGTILAMGEALAGLEAEERLDASGCLVIPGLVNGHTHAAMTCFRGVADDLPLERWLAEHIFPLERRCVDEELVYWGSRLACLEMVRGGVTAFADMYFFEDQVAWAAQEVGLRALLGEGLLAVPSPAAPDPREALRRAEGFVDRWIGHRLVRPSVDPHAVYTCSDELLRRASEVARRWGVPLVIHLQETRAEMAEARRRWGCSPLQYLERLGVLEGEVVACHLVHLEEGDLELAARRGVRVIHCPESNAKLAAGVAPVPEMLRRGLVVGLGTDGPASNNDLDLFGEMGFAAKLHKAVRGDPTVLPARQVLEMATRQGARALGLPGGVIEVGGVADLVVVELGAPHAVPLHDPYSHLVYAAKAADVRDVIVDGRVVMRNRRVLTVDEAETLERVQRLAARVQRS